ncbi:histidine triad (HIT) protein, partial [candidate division TM7 genomosp. GTL1]
LSPEERKKQINYRDARFNKTYDGIWQNVGKCVFCDLRDKYIIYEKNGVALTIILFAYIDGHLMIIPRRHVVSPKELTSLEWETIRKFMYIAKKIIKQVHGIKGVQFVQKDGLDAQSTVGHVHYHGIPFDAPDLNVWNYRKLQHTPLENAQLYKSLGKKLEDIAKKYDEKYAEAEKTIDSLAVDWADLAFGNKKPLNSLRATFIAAPREISERRFTSLVKTYLPKSNIILGLAKEDFIDGFEGQPQFKTLQRETIEKIINKVNAASPKYKIYTLRYFQRETSYIFEKLDFQKVVLINGSWHRAFHTRGEYYVLANRHTPYEMVSPFVDEAEAKTYEQQMEKQIKIPENGKILSETEMLATSKIASKKSFDYSFQTGVALGKKTKKGYKLLETSYNRVVPYQTYAMHFGASREKNFSPPNDLNHYDAVHAEVEMIVKAGKQRASLKGTTLFINLLPCPSCARMFAETDIEEFVYSIDHSSGYAIDLLEKAGKKVRRIVK